jgi:hypothetical protein
VLATYVAINLGVAGVHHHAHVGSAAACQVDGMPVRTLVTAAIAADDDEDVCPICNVLHIVKTLPTAAPQIAMAAEAPEAIIVARAEYVPPQTQALHSRDSPG